MEGFLAEDNMTFHRYLSVDLLASFFIVFADQTLDNKIEVVLHFSLPDHKFFLAKSPQLYHREKAFGEFFFRNIGKLA
jgi:hypothetical protein